LGIQALLQRDRCHEEEVRLRKERCNLQRWFMEEWICIKASRAAASKHLVIPYQKLLTFLLSL
jgi:hypothetical protein